MKLNTKCGKVVDLGPYAEVIKDNASKGRDLRERTPIGKNCKGEYFWWEDEGVFYDLYNKEVDKEIQLIINS